MDEEPVHGMANLVRILLPAVLPVLGSRFVFYGHSMGALVAFELARQARRCFGIEPDHLIVSGCPAPTQIRHINRHQMPDAQLWESVRALGGMHPGIASDPRMRALLLPVLRADFSIWETYSYLPDAPLTCPISAFGGTQDNDVRVSDLVAWSDETRGDFRCEQFSGGHFFNVEQAGQFADRVLGELALSLAPAGHGARQCLTAGKEPAAGSRAGVPGR